MDSSLAVIGIGADGWSSLGEGPRAEVLEAEVLLGGSRHLALVPPVPGQLRTSWPSPLVEGLPALLAEHAGRRVVALASGDPLVSGVGTTLVGLLGAERVRVVPTVSSVALARARMRWPAETTEVVTLVGRDPDALRRSLSDRHRLLVLSSDAGTPGRIADLLVDAGFGASTMTVLGDLGTDHESVRTAPASAWTGESPDLNVVAVRCRGEGLGWSPGLPDEAFESDGQLTRRDVRASALARLAPGPGQLLWDVGAGAGSVGIEWLRTHPSLRAFAVEADADRAARITRNAARLGVPRLAVVVGSAPGALADLPTPDAVFVGGGATRDGVLDTVLGALRPGGRLVVHGVTHQTEALLLDRYAALGGELTRVQVESAAPIGGFSGWTPARAITQWAYRKDRP